VYIDNTTGLTIDLPGTHSADKLKAAIPLAIKVAARPNNVNESIPWEPIVAQDKLKAEEGLTETKVILGWHFNFWTLTVTLPEHKHIAWLGETQTMIDSGKTTKKALESTIRRLGHVGFVIPWVFHFLSCLQTLSGRAQNRQRIAVNVECKNDLVLMLKILDKAKGGIDMNLLGFRSPDHIYYSDSCPAGVGGYSNQGFVWHFHIPDDLLFRALNNLLEFLAAVITLWIDIVNGRLSPGDCALLMTDSTTAKGWMRKSNFSKPDDNPVQAQTCVNAARKYAKIFLNADVKGYSQWFEGKRNNVADTLSREWHRTNNKLTSILRSLFPNQMPGHFKILPLPSEISSWLISLLQQLPMSERLQEEHTTAKLEPGDDVRNIASLSDAATFSWTPLQDTNELSCLEHLQWLSGKDDSRGITMRRWLKAQSEVPCHMWCRPSGRQEDRTPEKTRTMSLASFYHDSIKHTKTTIPNKNNKRPFHSSCSTN
jgi:hypothetical protein